MLEMLALLIVVVTSAVGCQRLSHPTGPGGPDGSGGPGAAVRLAGPPSPPLNLEALRSGCADGQREGFLDLERYQRIAGCSGAWTTPGIFRFNPGEAPHCPGVPSHDTTRWTCGGAGDDSERPEGEGCNVADLCAAGWHVCEGAADVAASSLDGCAGATALGDPPLFFAARQSSTGCVVCATGDRVDVGCDPNTCATDCRQTAATSNDVFGCGNFGADVTSAACSPLDRFSHDKCSALGASPWSCDLPGPADDRGVCEAYTLTKRASTHGGVLCCRDVSVAGEQRATAPAIRCDGARAAPARLSLVDEGMHSIAIEGVTSLSGSASIAILSIRQDEPIGGEHHAADASGVGQAFASVRAMRGAQDGRVYHLVFRATQADGASCVGEVTVCVPGSRGGDCKDNGALFDATEAR